MGLRINRDREAEAREIARVIPVLTRVGKLIAKLKQHDTHNSGADLSAQEVHDLMFLIKTMRDGAKRTPHG